MNKSLLDLTLEKWIAATPVAVFDAWTDPRVVMLWWGLEEAVCPKVDIDLKVGGKYRIENLLPGGRLVVIRGIYQIIVRPQQLVYTWSVDRGPDELVDVQIRPEGTGSLVTIRHRGIPNKNTLKGHLRGWQSSLAQLKAHLERR